MIAIARELVMEGLDATAIRARFAEAYDATTASRIIGRLRAGGELPPKAVKLTLLHLKPAPAVRDRLRRVAAKAGVSHHRAAHLAFLAGLKAMEERA